MKKLLFRSFLLSIFIATIIGRIAYGQTPAAGVATFQFQTGTQTNSSSNFADFVPTSVLTADGGFGYEFITQCTGATTSFYPQVSYVNFSGTDATLSFDRSNNAITVTAAFIRSARTGAATTQGLTSKPVAGGEFRFTSLDLLAISAATTSVSLQAYKNGVAVGSAVLVTGLSTSTKKPVDLSANSDFYNIDEIGITGFAADGIRVDNLTTAAIPFFINSPATNTYYNIGNNFTISVTNPPSGTLGVDYFANGVQLGTRSTVSPFSVNATATTGGSYSIVAKAYNATSAGTLLGTTAAIIVNVYPPAPSTTDGSNCGTGPVSVSASGTPTGGTFYLYSAATGGTAISSSTSTTFSTPSISATTTYYVSYAVSGVESTSRTAVTATINTLPTAAFTATTPVVINANSTVTLTSTYSASLTYAWNFNGGTPSTGSGQGPFSVQWSTAGTKNITLTVTSAAGCTTATASQSVTVNTPVPTVTGAGSGCGAGSVTLTAAGGQPTGGVYNWYGVATGGTALATGTTFAPITSGTYYVDYTAGGVTSSRSTGSVVTINPIVSSPTSNAYFSYSFDGNINDISGNLNDGVLSASPPAATTGRFGAPSAAYNFTGTSSQYIYTSKSVVNPQTFTISAWFNTTTTTGGLIVGFSSQTNGQAQHDRKIYMDNAGKLYFGVYSGATNTIVTAGTYNDGNWHHVVATLSAANGTRLYVDNTLQAFNASFIAAEPHNGYWLIGGPYVNGWPNAPTSNYFTGKIDDVSVFSTEMTAAAVAASNNVNQIGAYGPVCVGSPITIYSPTITGATYSWKDPNGTTLTGTANSTTFPLAVAGTYTLTVTNGPGSCTSTATYTPTLYALPAPVITSPATVATGASAAFSTTAVAGETYSWTTDGGTPATGTGNTISVNWATAGVKKVIVTATNANGCSVSVTQTIAVTKTVASGNYAFSQGITVSALGNTGTLSNFPMLVYIKEDALKSAVNCANNVQFPTGLSAVNGYDFAFTTNGGTNELFYQVESFDATTGTLTAWVQVPTVTTAATSLTFYFGSAAPAHDASFAYGTWSSDYLAVYHFNEGSGTVLDGTTYQRSSTATNATSTTAGKVSSAYLFDGTSTKIVSASSADITGNFTLSGWAFVTDFSSSDRKIVTNQSNSANGGYKLGYYGGSATTVKAEIETRAYSGASTLNRGEAGGTIVTTGAWHYVQGVYTGTNFITYFDGVADRSGTTGATAGTGGPIIVGSDFGTGNFFKGTLDEIRVSNVVKSADWIKAEYFNQNNYLTTTATNADFTTNAANAKAIGGSIVYTWTGATNTSTTAPGNWKTPASNNPVATIAIPTDGSASIIVNNVTNKPSLAAAATFYGVTVAAGSSLDLNGNTLTVGCNVYNSGTINTAGTTNTSTLIFNGSAATQTYTAAATSNTASIGTMTVNNTAGGTITVSGGPIDVYNQLVITKGNLTIAGTTTLSLKSSGTLTANVPAIPSTYAITGNVTVERWFTGGSISNRGWRMLSSPVNNNTISPLAANGTTATTATFNFSSLKTNLLITGVGGSGAGFDQPSGYTANGSTILFYTPSNALFTWPTSLNTVPTRPVGSGFYFYFRGNNTTNTVGKVIKSGGVYTAPEANVVGLQTGTLNQQAFRYTLSYTATTGVKNFNLVGNPYPSTISMSSTPQTGTTGFIYTYTPGATAIFTQPGAINIASGQGFYVKANAATSYISFAETLKTATQPTGASLLMGVPVEIKEPMITMKMIQDSSNYDITYLRYLDSYKDTYYDMEDADDLNGSGQTVFFGALTSDKKLVAIASQPMAKQRTSVFLSVDDATTGIYTLKRTGLIGIPAAYDVYLMDHFKKDSLDLRANDTYSFNLNKSNTATFGNERFEVIIRKKTLPPYKLVAFTGEKTGNDVLLRWDTQNEFDYTGFELQKSYDNATFEAVRNMQSTSAGTYTYKDLFSVTDSKPVYYRLKQTDINDNISYSQVVIITTNGNGTFSVFPNPATNVIQFSLAKPIKSQVRLRIYNSMGILMKTSIFTTSTGQQDISSLPIGSYTIEIVDLSTKTPTLTGKFIKL
ncbi:LamG-like jellyroll fold domain-containing protein [Mucilaginibacter gilvus]|uniref:T9SS type A sorting domain-containing protein n=1 Tax=Mucilaginibacter gilvus TaxID=2305909 RepID=A0A444MIE1_9SPHI|nr:LamG-like jellyroll fold domain-containing protein [Mucilaginibacter gilvus]RWY47874.1 T9SS type A sorting domain-containing protein [Mucilaginibacter gilvus]